MSYIFDGTNKLIILPSGVSLISAIDLYSRWKDWVATGDNSKFVQAFTISGGDPIGSGQTISSYIFLNTTDGWRIQPDSADYELKITGNLYSIDAGLTMFVPITNHTVSIIIERSSASITSSGSGVDQSTVQSAMTAQGYTAQRAIKIDSLDENISSRAVPGEGLTSQQAIALDRIDQVVQSNADVIADIYDAKLGRWKLENNFLIFYRSDNTTELARFSLYDENGYSTMRNVYDRRRV